MNNTAYNRVPPVGRFYPAVECVCKLIRIYLIMYHIYYCNTSSTIFSVDCGIRVSLKVSEPGEWKLGDSRAINCPW